MSEWPKTGFVTIKQILGRHGGPMPCGPTRWWDGVKSGEFPAALKVAGRTVWRVRDIDALVEELDRSGGQEHRFPRLARAD
jgi:prophage regulatory protein